MTANLTSFQKQLCNALQNGLPICPEPFRALAKDLGANEHEVLREAEQLKKLGIIRRITALINYKALGKITTLIAAHVSKDALPAVVDAVNALQGVSHNYLRAHFYNLWFTLQGDSPEAIELTMSNLSTDLDIDFHSLPAKRRFKLDVRFNTDLPLCHSERSKESCPIPPKTQKADLTEHEKAILSELPQELEIISRPFDCLVTDTAKINATVRTIQSLIDKGVIRRIAAIVNYRKLGFTANVLFCSQIHKDKIIQAGKSLSQLEIVSHCYEREPFRGWPYNLFAMMHAKTMAPIKHAIENFVEQRQIENFKLLPTTAELKKKSSEINC